MRRRFVHPVYLLGIMAVAYLKFWRVPIYGSRPWSEISEWIIALLS